MNAPPPSRPSLPHEIDELFQEYVNDTWDGWLIVWARLVYNAYQVCDAISNTECLGPEHEYTDVLKAALVLSENFNCVGARKYFRRMEEILKAILGEEAYKSMRCNDPPSFSKSYVRYRNEDPSRFDDLFRRFAEGVARSDKTQREKERENEAELRRVARPDDLPVDQPASIDPSPPPWLFPAASSITGQTRSSNGPENTPTPTPRKRKGRKLESDLDADKRVFDGWRDSGCRTYEDYARICGTTSKQVQDAVDRHRKRLKQQKKSD